MTRYVTSGPGLDFDAVAWSWVDHLRHRGCTPWRDWVANAEPASPAAAARLPGAAQLETVRRLACRPGAGQVAFTDLADLVLHRAAPGRGPDDLPLLWPFEDSRSGFGPPPVDPARIASSELVRVLVGAVAELLVRSPSEEPRPRRRRRLRVPVVGSPALAPGVRSALPGSAERARGTGRERARVVVLAEPVDRLLGETWAQRMRRGGIAPWPRYVERFARSGALPRAADVAGTAERWAERVGADHVHVVVVGPGEEYDAGRAAADVLGVQLDDAAAPEPQRPTPAQAELLRQLNQVLRGRTRPDRHRALVNGLVPRLADAPVDHRLTLPARHVDWARGIAERTVQRLQHGGFPLYGEPAGLLPSSSGSSAPSDWDLLDLALDTCLSLAGAPATSAVPTPGGARR